VSSWAGLLSPDSYVGVVRDRFLVVSEDSGGITGFGQLNQTSGEVDAVLELKQRKRWMLAAR